MSRVITYPVICLLVACSFFPVFSAAETPTPDDRKSAQTVTLLFTNDLESTYDPVAAYWRDDMEHIGGIAQLATLIEQLRASEENVFLFDAGDIFTGVLAKLTQGEVSFELMNTMAYDAMAIGNHEFEYGWEVLARQKHRVPFPVWREPLSTRAPTSIRPAVYHQRAWRGPQVAG